MILLQGRSDVRGSTQAHRTAARRAAVLSSPSVVAWRDPIRAELDRIAEARARADALRTRRDRLLAFLGRKAIGDVDADPGLVAVIVAVLDRISIIHDELDRAGQ